MKRKEGRRLVKVPHVAEATQILWDLMLEAEPNQVISHKKVPDWDDHVSFVKRFPYRMWYLIEVDGEFVGSIYFSRRNEIGIRIFRKFHRKGYGSWAIREIIRMWATEVSKSAVPSVMPCAFIANINPGNAASKKAFEALGFKHVQETYALDVPELPRG